MENVLKIPIPVDDKAMFHTIQELLENNYALIPTKKGFKTKVIGTYEYNIEQSTIIIDLEPQKRY